MKKILLLVGLAIFIEQLHAQETSLWVGVSKNSDPLIRRQEAFMNALCQYIACDAVSASETDDTNGHQKLIENSIENCCRFEILSDIIDEDGETITLSIGRGTLINYGFMSSSLTTGDKTQTDIELIITYGEDSERNKMRSRHQYRTRYIERRDTAGCIQTSVDEFKYECENIVAYE